MSDYLNQTIPYKKFLRTDAYGKAVYAAAVKIPCRTRMSRVLVRSALGKEVVSEGKIYTAIRVFPQDIFVIDGKEVKVICPNERMGFDGAFDHCEARI